MQLGLKHFKSFDIESQKMNFLWQYVDVFSQYKKSYNADLWLKKLCLVFWQNSFVLKQPLLRLLI